MWRRGSKRRDLDSNDEKKEDSNEDIETERLEETLEVIPDIGNSIKTNLTIGQDDRQLPTVGMLKNNIDQCCLQYPKIVQNLERKHGTPLGFSRLFDQVISISELQKEEDEVWNLDDIFDELIF